MKAYCLCRLMLIFYTIRHLYLSIGIVSNISLIEEKLEFGSLWE